MPFGDALISFVIPKVHAGLALFLKCVTKEEEETKEDSNNGKDSCGDINQITKRLCLKNWK